MTSTSSNVSNGSRRGPGPGRPGLGTSASAIPIASPIASTTAVHNAGLTAHFRSLRSTSVTSRLHSRLHISHDVLEDGPARFDGGGEEVHLAVPLPRGRDEPVLPQDPQVMPDRLVVQGQAFRELLGVPRLVPDRDEDPGAGGRPDAAPEEPPQDPFETVHATGAGKRLALVVPCRRSKKRDRSGGPCPGRRRRRPSGSLSGIDEPAGRRGRVRPVAGVPGGGVARPGDSRGRGVAGGEGSRG